MVTTNTAKYPKTKKINRIIILINEKKSKIGKVRIGKEIVSLKAHIDTKHLELKKKCL